MNRGIALKCKNHYALTVPVRRKFLFWQKKFKRFAHKPVGALNALGKCQLEWKQLLNMAEWSYSKHSGNWRSTLMLLARCTTLRRIYCAATDTTCQIVIAVFTEVLRWLKLSPFLYSPCQYVIWKTTSSENSPVRSFLSISHGTLFQMKYVYLPQPWRWYIVKMRTYCQRHFRNCRMWTTYTTT